jgi:DNA-binding transcriptional LysR family regulator
MKIADIRTLQVLMAVQSEKSYAGAARLLGLTRAAVSRNITEAEQRLNLRLTKRTTRRVELAPAATELLNRVAQPLQHIESAIASLEDDQQALKGRINISVTHAYGCHFVLPLLCEFARQHPQVDYSVSLSEAIENLVTSPLDLTIRMGSPEAENIIARRLRPVTIGVYAGAGFNVDMSIQELAAAQKIAFRVPGTQRLYNWNLESVAGELYDFDLSRQAFEVDSIEGVMELTRAGVGVALLPDYLAETELRQGKLIRLFSDYHVPSVDCFLCYFHRQHIPRRIRVLIEFLVEKLGKYRE